jgi:protease-4
MKKFLKYILATVIGVIISAILLFLFFLGIIGALVSSSEKQAEVKPKSILILTLDKEITDRASNNPFEDINFMEFKKEHKLGLNDILDDIKKAKNDDNIKGIYLEFTNIPTGFATIEEIRNAILDFKKSGKFVIAYSDFYEQKSYYLASVADKIYMNPQGKLFLIGLRGEVIFYKGTLEKLGIEPEIIRHGKFKSAVEPFMKEKMSDENRLQITSFLNSIWNHMLDGISKQRNTSKGELNFIANKLISTNPDLCLAHKLVDSLIYKDQVNEMLMKLSGQSGKNPKFITIEKYNKVPKNIKGKGFAKSKIAIVYAYGDVDMGNGGEGTVSSERISKALYEARVDSSIKAIVFRINSPGGSALASEVIWREIALASKTKPVVASMGNLAASGGYYIACAADTIVASPNTITGSIGVFGFMFNCKDFLNKKLGITTDVAKTNEHADILTISRPLSIVEKEVLQNEVDRTYDTFISHVAEGRKMKKETVDKIAQGRVWTGIEAKDIGLVDIIGGLDDAIQIAAKMAKIENYRVIALPKLEEPFEELISDLTGDVKTKILVNELGESYWYYEKYINIMKMEGIQTRMSFDVEIK